MSEPPELMKEVARWIEKAEHDCLAADHAMELAKEGLTDQSLRMSNRGTVCDDGSRQPQGPVDLKVPQGREKEDMPQWVCRPWRDFLYLFAPATQP